jgi:SAM-dependent methyltransferase
MPREWDQYYADAADIDWTPEALVVEAAEIMQPGRALDLACGAGRNAVYLAQLGWSVTAVDSSPPAIRSLRERAAGLDVDARSADLEQGEFAVEPEGFDLICCWLYLQRNLFSAIREGIKPGGAFVGAVRLDGSFAMKSGELREEFEGWKVLFYSEAGRTARILARRA